MSEEHEASGGRECPSEDELVQMVEGALDEAELAAIEAHVDGCESCAEVIAGLGALGRGAGAAGSGDSSGRGGSRRDGSGGGGSGRGGSGRGGGGRGGSGRDGSGRGSSGRDGSGRPRSGGEGGQSGLRTVGRYHLDRRIAAGGMGEVWAAWDPQLRREIAVKLVRPERADDGRERERLLREARALARLGHPNVLAVYDVGEIDGEVFIATELVAGETLASRGGPSTSWRELVRLYAQAARGLAAAHAAGLVHRDVKPANLLLGLDGRVRVADFGLAIRSSTPSPDAATELPTDEVSITATGFVAGTPAYMAPEQRAGRPPDARADQYALCVSLVEALDGRRPGAGITRDALVAFVAERRPREPELDTLCSVLARGLSIDPHRRYSDTDALADALERLLASGSRELESAETLSAVELPLPAGSRPDSRPDSRPGSRPRSSTGPRSDRGHSSEPGPTARARPISSRGPSSDRGQGSSRGYGSDRGQGSSRGYDSDRGQGSNRGYDSDRGQGSNRGYDSDRGQGSSRGYDSDRGQGSDSGPRSNRGYGSNPGYGADQEPRAGTGPRSGASSPPSTGPRSAAGARRDGAPRPEQAAPVGRRLAPFAIAGIAAAAGVAAVLLGARALSKKPAPPASAAGSAIAQPPAPAPSPLRVEPIDPGPGPDPGPGSGSAALPDLAPSPADGSGRAPARPAGVPLDLPRAPANKVVAVAPPAAGSHNELSTFAISIQKHLREHDVAACKRLIAGLPSNLDPVTRSSIETFAAFCDMMAGNCAGGTARLEKAQAGQGIQPQSAMLAQQYCPIEGPLETRLERLRTQVAAHTMGPAMDLPWCDLLIAPAKKAASEATTGPQRGVTAWALQQLAKCVGSAGRCDDARALWSLSNTVDESGKHKQPELGARCAAAAASLGATETYVDSKALLQSLTAAVRQRDVRECQKLAATPIPNVHPGQQHSIELFLAHCEMVAGDCAAGTARLQRIGPNASGTVDPTIRAMWLKGNVSLYCPITGDLDTRVERLWAKVDGFTTRDHGNLAWCDAIIPAAKSIAGEVASAAHRKRIGFALQRLAMCVGLAGRCDQGRELWALSTQVDPNVAATPALGAKCP